MLCSRDLNAACAFQWTNSFPTSHQNTSKRVDTDAFRSCFPLFPMNGAGRALTLLLTVSSGHQQSFGTLQNAVSLCLAKILFASGEGRSRRRQPSLAVQVASSGQQGLTAKRSRVAAFNSISHSMILIWTMRVWKFSSNRWREVNFSQVIFEYICT